MSSSLGTRDLAKNNLWQEFGVVYADSQMMGASGFTFLLVREDVLDRIQSREQRQPIPAALEWDQSSEAHTSRPSMLSLYTAKLMCEYMIKMGGVSYFEKQAALRSRAFYQSFESSIGKQFKFRNKVPIKYRSRLNIPFNLVEKRTVNREMEQRLFRRLERAGFSGLQTEGGLKANLCHTMEDSHI
jgi:phosphoserine aminotransferase